MGKLAIWIISQGPIRKMSFEAQDSTQPSMAPSSVVLFSTPTSVDNSTLSIAAAVEVVLSVLVFVGFIVYFGVTLYLSLVIVIAPLLLLRSDESIRYGLNLFQQYITGDINKFIDNPEKTFRSVAFWRSVTFSAFSGGISIFFLIKLLSYTHLFNSPIGLLIATIVSADLALAFAIASSAREVVIVAQNRAPASIVTFALVMAIGIGVVAATLDISKGIWAMIFAFLLALLAIMRAPKIIKQVFEIEIGQKSNKTGDFLTVARAVVAGSPRSFLVFLPGFVFGFFVRCFLIRLLATLRFFPLGVQALPSNWWNALFCVDFNVLPS
jgi:hypothetical protein